MVPVSRRAIVIVVLLAAAALVALALGLAARRTGGDGEPPCKSHGDIPLPSVGEPLADLWIGGDVHLGDRVPDLMALGLSGTGVVNLEGPAGDGADASTSERLANAPELLPRLLPFGVRVVGIANNHAGDHGSESLVHTADASRRAGLVPAGGPAGVALVSVGGLTLAITAHDLGAGISPRLKDELAAARAKGDALVATFHVTGPPLYLPRPELRAAVQMALEAGARVVAAHGTHAIGPVERRGDVVIAWGLGNMLFACDCTREDEGAVLHVSIPRHGPVRAAIMPVRAGLAGAPARKEPDPSMVFDLLEALGSTSLRRDADRASF